MSAWLAAHGNKKERESNDMKFKLTSLEKKWVLYDVP